MLRLNLVAGVEGEAQIGFRRLTFLDPLAESLFDDFFQVEPLAAHFAVFPFDIPLRRPSEIRRGLRLVSDAVAHLLPLALVIFQRLALLLGKPRLLLRDAVYGLFLRAPVALALL